MCEIEGETVGTGMPVLLGIWDSFEWTHGYEQSPSQGGRDELVRLPDALSRTNLETDVCASASVHDIDRNDPYFNPSLWITQRRISAELLKYIIDLDIEVRREEWSEDSDALPW